MNKRHLLFPGECPALSLGTWRLCVRLWWRTNSLLRGWRSARKHCWRCFRWEEALPSASCLWFYANRCPGCVAVENPPSTQHNVLLMQYLCNLQYNKFKCRILNEKVTTPTTTVYRYNISLCLCLSLMTAKTNRNVFVFWNGVCMCVSSR